MGELAIHTSVDAPVLHHGDCLAFMRTMPAASVHLIFVDPPYFKVKAEAWDRQWDKPAGFLAWIGELADECRTIIGRIVGDKPQGAVGGSQSADEVWSAGNRLEALIRHQDPLNIQQPAANLHCV